MHKYFVGKPELTRVCLAGACTRLCVHSTRDRRVERRASRVDDGAARITSILSRTYVLPIIVLQTMFNLILEVTSELMFEQYSVPTLAFCIDSVMSFYQNNLPSKPNVPFAQDGLVISFNTASTSVIPILSGRGILSQAKR